MQTRERSREVFDLTAGPAGDEYDWKKYEGRELPPGQHTAKKFPHLEYANIPRDVGDPYSWPMSFEVPQRIAPVETTLGELLSNMNQSFVEDFTQDFHCITGWSVLDLNWQGIPGAALCDYLRVPPEVTSVLVKSRDLFTTSLWLEDFRQGIIAVGYDGKPLSPKHGFPVRFVAPPHLYMYKSAKWMTGVDFFVEHQVGFWEQRAYSDSAVVAANDRYTNPAMLAMTPGQIRKEFG